jgi:biopolymer transport protein TolR
MKGRPRKQRLVTEINITPFTDVILVLLVIFMITTPLVTQVHFKVNLPEAKSGLPVEVGRQARVAISITNEGLVYLDEKLVTRKELRESVNMMRKDHPDLSVILESDRTVRFKDIVDVLDILTEVGVRNLNIAATIE